MSLSGSSPAELATLRTWPQYFVLFCKTPSCRRCMKAGTRFGIGMAVLTSEPQSLVCNVVKSDFRVFTICLSKRRGADFGAGASLV